jgi:RES domain-containing protein
VRRALAAQALTGDGAARFPGRWNNRGIRAVYLADCPAGCGLELLAHYAAPEALMTHVLLEVEVTAALIDLREARVLRRYGVRAEDLVALGDPVVPRQLAARLLAERRPGAIVPSATVARAFNVVVYPDVWDRFALRATGPLALDDRLLGLAGPGPEPPATA